MKTPQSTHYAIISCFVQVQVVSTVMPILYVSTQE